MRHRRPRQFHNTPNTGNSQVTPLALVGEGGGTAFAGVNPMIPGAVEESVRTRTEHIKRIVFVGCIHTSLCSLLATKEREF